MWLRVKNHWFIKWITWWSNHERKWNYRQIYDQFEIATYPTDQRNRHKIEICFKINNWPIFAIWLVVPVITSRYGRAENNRHASYNRQTAHLPFSLSIRKEQLRCVLIAAPSLWVIFHELLLIQMIPIYNNAKYV